VFKTLHDLKTYTVTLLISPLVLHTTSNIHTFPHGYLLHVFEHTHTRQRLIDCDHLHVPACNTASRIGDDSSDWDKSPSAHYTMA